MLLKSIFAAVALASSVVADGAAIADAMDLVTNDTIALNSTVSAWKGNPLTVLEIVGQSTKLLLDINSATSVAKKSANLTVLETIGVAEKTLTLATDVETTLATIVAKKQLFADELLQGAILLNLELEKAATDKFSAAVIEKVPESLQATAASLTAPIDTAFESAIAAYEEF